jgi:hypothetical protein
MTVLVCTADPQGCLTATMQTCGANRTCQGAAGNAVCTCNNSCTATQLGTYCKSPTTVATCTADSSAMPTCYVSTGDVVCPGAKLCVAGPNGATCQCPMPVCAAGDRRCGPGGGLQTCIVDSTTTCPAWGAEVPCGPNRACTGDAPAAACACNNTCAANQFGSYCKGPTTIATCTADATGTPTCYLSSGDTVCTGAKVCVAGAGGATCQCPTPVCNVGDKRCGPGGGLQTCAVDAATTCPAWGPEVPCGTNRMCTGTAPTAACACNDTCSVGQTGSYCKNATTIATCTADTSAVPTCYVASAEMACPGGLPCTGAAPNARCGNIPHVFVIAMENRDAADIYGNAKAPYINGTLMAQGGHASNYADVLAISIPSEAHYVWMEAGTSTFSDVTFTSDADPSSSNSTADTNHLATKLVAAGKSWRSYQEDLDPAKTGVCPINSSGFYAAKHDPFVFFKDIVGSPPSGSATTCSSRHRPYTTAGFQADLNANDVAAYTFITPNLCNDMHGASTSTNGCTSGGASACISGGDSWLATNVPPILSYINTHGGVLLVVWDESETSPLQPFLIIGPNVKANYTSSVAYDHGSYVKSLERIFGLPVNSRVAATNDFADFFTAGKFP